MVRLMRCALVVSLVLLLASSVTAQEKVELLWWYRGGEERFEKFTSAVIESFEAKYPHIKVVWEPTPPAWNDAIVVRTAAGTGPDIFEFWHTPARSLGEQGFTLDLYPYWSRGINIERDDFFPNIMDAGFLHHGEQAGTLYGLPRYINMGGTYFVNPDLLQAAGLTPIEDLVDQDAWDWEALREYGHKLTRRDADGKATQAGILGSLQAPLYTFILSNDGQVFDYPERPWDFRMNEPAAIEALEFVRQLVWDDRVWFSDTAGRGPEFLGGNWRDQFGSGKAAIVATGFNLQAPFFNELIGDRFRWQDMVPVPSSPVGKRRGTNAKDLYGINAATKHPEEAWLFLTHLVSVDVQREMMHLSREMPVRISLLPEFLQMLGELYDVPERNLQYLVEAAHNTQVNPEAVFINASQTGPLIHQAFRKSIWTNELPVEIAIGEIVEAIIAAQREIVGDVVDQ